MCVPFCRPEYLWRAIVASQFLSTPDIGTRLLLGTLSKWLLHISKNWSFYRAIVPATILHTPGGRFHVAGHGVPRCASWDTPTPRKHGSSTHACRRKSPCCTPPLAFVPWTVLIPVVSPSRL